MTSLEEALKNYRLVEARAKEQPAFCIFSNKVLDAIVAAHPQNDSELLAVPGMGKAKVGQFGSGIIQCCKRFQPSLGSGRDGSAAPYSGFKRALDAAAANGGKPPVPVAGGARKLPWAATPDPPHLYLGDASSSSDTTGAANALPIIPHSDLNSEQKAAAAYAIEGKSCFFSGAAGTGKSFLLRYVIQELRQRDAGAVAVTAPTGIAASHIGGQTLHSWAGVGLAKGRPEVIVEKVTKNAAAVARWTRASVLVVDEVSMVDSELLAVLDACGRAARGAPAVPFGGVQLVCCGDFFQLPPVGLGQYGRGFAFESPTWRAAGLRSFVLATPVRQQGDATFARLLNEVHVGVGRTLAGFHPRSLCFFFSSLFFSCSCGCLRVCRSVSATRARRPWQPSRAATCAASRHRATASSQRGSTAPMRTWTRRTTTGSRAFPARPWS